MPTLMFGNLIGHVFATDDKKGKDVTTSLFKKVEGKAMFLHQKNQGS